MDIEGNKATISDLVDVATDELFVDVHSLIGTKTGDISPEQAFELDEIKEKLCALLYEQAMQNI